MEAKLMLSSGQGDLLNKENATPMVAVMAFSGGKEPSSSAEAAKAPTVDMDARLMVSTGHADCKKLKNLLTQKDATITVALTASCNQDSEANPSFNSLQLRLLAAASEGDSKGLETLFSRLQETTGDVEEGTNKKVDALSDAALSLLKVVTADGDTALHLVAASGAKDNGDSEKFKNKWAELIRKKAESLLYKKNKKGDTLSATQCAKLIHTNKGGSLLYEKNNNGDTPLHFAARAGNYKLVSCLIDLAKLDGRVQELIRMENKNKETALHEAVRRGHNQMVSELLSQDRELASLPINGSSPLYLAIQLINDRAILKKEDRYIKESSDVKEDRQASSKEVSDVKKDEQKSMAQTLYDESFGHLVFGKEKSFGHLSYLGPEGQNALHAAVLRGPVLTRKLLRWARDLNKKRPNEDLTVQRDKNGSTPLHFAASLRGAYWRGSVCSELLRANKDALYQLDHDGLFPIHVAASVGAFSAIALFVEVSPCSAGLRDAKGRTFLHVAVENKQRGTVSTACKNPSLAWIMNMQDNDGNTALHLAVQAGSLLMFSALFGNRKVDLNITNAEGQTPLDIAEHKVPPSGLRYNQNSEEKICEALKMAGAWTGTSRQDFIQKKYQDTHSGYEREELENMKDLTQTGSIVSVLIATVAFGATFALPGGYRADDHTNGGTPTLAGRYAFDAFMMANTLAFLFSAAAIICGSRGGSPTFNRRSRVIYLGIYFSFLKISVTCFTAAFALGVFLVLSPVARKTAIAICVMSPLAVLCNNAEFWMKQLLFLPSYCVRKGLLWTSGRYIVVFVLNTLYEFWPFLLIFIWAAYGRTHPSSKVEPPVQSPSF